MMASAPVCHGQSTDLQPRARAPAEGMPVGFPAREARLGFKFQHYHARAKTLEFWAEQKNGQDNNFQLVSHWVFLHVQIYTIDSYQT